MYQGSSLEDNGKHHKRKWKIFDGTENWQLSTNPDFFYLEMITKKVDNEIMIISSHFKGVSFNDRGNGETNIIYSVGTYIVLRNTEFTTINELKTFLAEQYANNTPVIVEYELAEEETITYNSTQQAQYEAIQNAYTYADETNVSSESDELPPILEVQYWLKDDSEIETQENNLSFTPIENEDEITNEINIINEDDIIESEVIPYEEDN